MNEKLFFILFNFSNKTENRKKIIVLLTKFTCKLFFYAYVITFFYLIFNIQKYGYLIILKYLIIPMFAFFIARILRITIKAKRPFEKMNIKSLIYHKGGNSFPSNHSTSAMVLAISIGYIFNFLLVPLIILALITGILRIMCGVHYPIDVFFGFIIGYFLGYYGFFTLF